MMRTDSRPQSLVTLGGDTIVRHGDELGPLTSAEAANYFTQYNDEPLPAPTFHFEMNSLGFPFIE